MPVLTHSSPPPLEQDRHEEAAAREAAAREASAREAAAHEAAAREAAAREATAREAADLEVSTSYHCSLLTIPSIRLPPSSPSLCTGRWWRCA